MLPSVKPLARTVSVPPGVTLLGETNMVLPLGAILLADVLNVVWGVNVLCVVWVQPSFTVAQTV